jgi:transposase
MNSSRRRYSREFKLEVIRRVRDSGVSQAQVAKDLGISPNTLSRWIKQFREEKGEAFPGKGHQTSQAAEISRLRRENARLRKERDFLKKTASYFATQNEPDTE